MLSGSSRKDGADRADRLARTRHSGDAVNLRCGVSSQDVSGGQRGAVVGRSTLCEDRRAVRHELGESLGDRIGLCRVDDRGSVTRDVGGCRLCRLAAVLARGHGNNAGGEGGRGVSATGDSHGAGGDGGVCCGSLRVVLWRLRLATGGPGASRVRSTSGIDWRFTVSPSGIDRGFAVRLGGMSWRLAMRFRGMGWGLAVSSSGIDRRLAPARVYDGRVRRR